MIPYPDGLNQEVLSRSWEAGNGELGLMPEDIEEFFTACARDQIALLGWELWIIDHCRHIDLGLTPCPGRWFGSIPLNIREQDAVVGGDVDNRRPEESWPDFVKRSIAETRAQIDGFNLAEVREFYRPFLRYNFTMVDEQRGMNY